MIRSKINEMSRDLGLFPIDLNLRFTVELPKLLNFSLI